AERTVDLVFGVLPHTARVEKDDIGFSRLVNQLVTLAAQSSHDQLAVEDVHLAADGFDVQLLGHDGSVASCPLFMSFRRRESYHANGAIPLRDCRCENS